MQITHTHMGHYMVRSHRDCDPNIFGALNFLFPSGSSPVCSRISPASASSIISCQRRSFGTTQLWWADFNIHMGFLEWGIPKAPWVSKWPWVSILKWSNLDMGYPHFGRPPYTFRGCNHQSWRYTKMGYSWHVLTAHSWLSWFMILAIWLFNTLLWNHRQFGSMISPSQTRWFPRRC